MSRRHLDPDYLTLYRYQPFEHAEVVRPIVMIVQWHRIATTRHIRSLGLHRRVERATNREASDQAVKHWL